MKIMGVSGFNFPSKSIDSQELVAEPHTMLVLLNSRWEYSYTPSGESLALQSFMLSEPAIYCLEDGDIWGGFLEGWEMLKYMIFQVKPLGECQNVPNWSKLERCHGWISCQEGLMLVNKNTSRLNFSACGWFPPIQTVQGVGLEMFPIWLVSDQQKPLPIKHGNWKSPIRIYKVLVGKASL